MATKQKTTATVVEDVAAPEVKKIPGFVPKGRVMRCNLPLDPEEGAEAGWFDLRGPVSIEETDVLQTMLNTGATYEAFWNRLCPRIVAWNAVAFDLATGEYQPVPPPSEGGHDSFRVVDAALTVLIAAAVVNKVLGRGDQTRPKASGPTPAPASGGD
jgi:hypothetical protein